jgi:molybdopterin/thiamine biosynthesis adenylyltransferase
MDKALYNEIFYRNQGLIDEAQQEKLKSARVVVFGLGGLGGVICEILVRSGILNLTLIDKDTFDVSNLNRQIYATQETIGRLKTESTRDALLNINPHLNLSMYDHVGEDNINELLQYADLALLALDETLACILISRVARNKNIPLVEGWALPFANVRVYTGATPGLEEVYNLPTMGKNLNNISKEEATELNLMMLLELKKIEGVEQYYDENIMEILQEKRIPSFAPMVWLNSCIMSFEAIKVLLHMGNISYAPKMAIYNPFEFRTI